MQTPHGGELSVLDPHGEFFKIIWDRPDVPGSLVPTDQFRDMAAVVLITDQVTGRASAGTAPQRVFSDTGLYWFGVGVIRSGGKVNGTCFVTYTG
jgi:hypothetical protein